MDAAAELFWIPSSTREGVTLRSTHLLGVAQYRPWVRHGFFLKGGMGFAFVKNWVYSTSSSDGAPPYTTTGLGLTYGTGWAFRPTGRVSMQIFGAHYVTTLGNLTTGTETTVENVIGNIWVVGAALVFR
jgi:hypothetical protein